ncbi:MAG: hypothetical protein KAS32_23610 [Candidatus Peribacteraceae bacterium]|nr:hypothetical protein [Candidatus Peribacteraceae bacterium]
MQLPVIPKSNFTVKLKSLDKSINVSPFTVAQEGIFLEAAQAKDKESQIASVKQIISECILSEGIDSGKLPFFDLEMLFIKLRIKSIGEILNLSYVCRHKIGTDDKDKPILCETPIKVAVNLNEFEYREDETHETKFMITDDIGITLKYPTLEMISLMDDDMTDSEAIIDCIDTVFTEDAVYSSTDHTKEELLNFFKPVTFIKRKEISDKFFKAAPRPVLKTVAVCEKCGTSHPINMVGITELFM